MLYKKHKILSIAFCVLSLGSFVSGLSFIGCARKPAVLEGYEEGVWLGFKFVPGKSLTYKQTINTYTAMEIKGMVQEVNSITEIQTTQTVEDTVDNIKLEISFDDISSTTRVGAQLIPVKEAEELKGKVVSLKLSKEGKLIELKGLEDIDYFKKSGEKPERQFEGLFSFLPNKVTKIGENWQKEFEEEKCTYTLQGFEQKDGFDCAKIAVKKEIEQTKDIEQKGMKIKMNIKGEEKGTIFFALKEGIIIESKATTSLEGEQELSGAGLPEPITVPIYIDQDTHTKLIQ
ncbi:hypothetical protein KAW65_08125 [candidate division WOR-3 bacterium]|nr:hypothetical protein [candidate division WOR-3 bacterium]